MLKKVILKFLVHFRWVWCIFLFSALLVAGLENNESGTVHLDHARSLIAEGEKLCIAGDPGSARIEQFAVAIAMNKAGCSQVRILGDLIYPDGLSSIEDPLLTSNFYRPFTRLLATTPFYLIQGNHDYNRGFTDIWLEIAARDSRITYPAHYYSETWDDICFISLDTTFLDKIYYVAERRDQYQWLEETLQKLQPGCKFSVVFGHHPYHSSGVHGDAGNLLNRFLEEKIIGVTDLYFAGHDHILADEGYAKRTRMLISGSAGKPGFVKEHSPDVRFAAEVSGFITLSFSYEDEGRIVGHFTMQSVDIASADPVPTAVWTGSTTGIGIRETQ